MNDEAARGHAGDSEVNRTAVTGGPATQCSAPACVSNFACHPESLADCNTEISPGFLGSMHETGEHDTGSLTNTSGRFP